MSHHLELDIIIKRFSLTIGRLLMLQHMLVVSLQDSQCLHLLQHCSSLFLLFQLLLFQIANIVDRFLQNCRLAQLVAR